MLHARECYWFETLHAELNKNIPTRTRKEWEKDNPEKTIEKGKRYYENNRDKYTEKNKKI
jgi:hypothetical protein